MWSYKTNTCIKATNKSMRTNQHHKQKVKGGIYIISSGEFRWDRMMQHDINKGFLGKVEIELSHELILDGNEIHPQQQRMCTILCLKQTEEYDIKH